MSTPSEVAAVSRVSDRDPRLLYALAVLLDQPLERMMWPDWLAYGDKQGTTTAPAVRIVPSGFFGEIYGTAASLPRLPLSEIDGVPLVFGTPQIERREGTLVIHADLLASAYFLTTRYEEWLRPEARDEHGRFPGKESLPYRAGVLHRPLVDEYAQLLRKWVADIGISLPAPQRKFSVLLSHDVDNLGSGYRWHQFAKPLAHALLGRRAWSIALGQAGAALGFSSDPANNMHEVIAADRRLTARYPATRCRAIYFFAAGGKHPLDPQYAINGRLARRAIRQVLDSGADIGIHASYGAGQHPNLLAEERRLLEAVAKVTINRNRHHYLAWRELAHSPAIAAAGIAWDATLGYADLPGFRLGVCRPIPLFDPITQRELGIMEHPLIVMECSLSKENYLGLKEQDAFELVRSLADTTLRYQGEFVALWHNDTASRHNQSYHPRLYRRFLDYLGTLLEQAGA